MNDSETHDAKSVAEPLEPRPTQNDEPADAQEAASAAAQASAAEKDDSASIIESLKSENADLRDKHARALAEMENVRRRTEREKQDTAKYAISAFARDVIVIGDNIRRAIEAVPESAAAADGALMTLLEGMEVTERELFKALERHGIKRFDPKGEKFDPNVHEAMMRVETADIAPDTVVKVVQAGYMIGERVLRPAAVIVAKAGTASRGEGGNGDASGREPGPEQGVAAGDALSEDRDAQGLSGMQDDIPFTRANGRGATLDVVQAAIGAQVSRMTRPASGMETAQPKDADMLRATRKTGFRKPTLANPVMNDSAFDDQPVKNERRVNGADGGSYTQE